MSFTPKTNLKFSPHVTSTKAPCVFDVSNAFFTFNIGPLWPDNNNGKTMIERRQSIISQAHSDSAAIQIDIENLMAAFAF